MESTEAKTHINELEKKLQERLLNAEAETEGGSPKVDTVNPVPDKRRVELSPVAVRIVCDIKNSIKSKILSKDCDESDRVFIELYFRTTDKEIEIYKRVLEDLGTNYCPEQYKEVLNKWLNNSLIVLIEHELESLIMFRKMLELDRKKREVKAA